MGTLSNVAQHPASLRTCLRRVETKLFIGVPTVPPTGGRDLRTLRTGVELILGTLLELDMDSSEQITEPDIAVRRAKDKRCRALRERAVSNE